jgi:hypothetical protein
MVLFKQVRRDKGWVKLIYVDLPLRTLIPRQYDGISTFEFGGCEHQ